MTKATGKCLCGEVTFTVEKVEEHYHACHCDMCRRWSSGPLFAASAEGVTFTGEENIRRYKSSEWAERAFCKICGSNLFYFFVPGQAHIMCVGAFDDPSKFRMTGEIYVDHQPDGYAFAGDLSRMTEAEVLEKFGASGD